MMARRSLLILHFRQERYLDAADQSSRGFDHVSIFRSGSAFDTSSVYDIFFKHKLDPHQLGMIIEDENGKLFALNDTKKLKPASLTKVLTAGAALEFLGSDYEFKTELFTDGVVGNRTLHGSLYLKAAGDPTFDTDKLIYFLSALERKNIKTVSGNIIIDDSDYSDLHTLNARPWLYATSRGNYPLFINVDPPANLVPFSRNWLKAERRVRRLLDLNDKFVIYQNMNQPDLWTGQHLAQLLRKHGIRVTGKVRRGRVPDSATVLHTVSNPLTKVIHEMLKSSNNYYADMMIRNLAAKAGEKPATVEAGMEFIYVFLDHVGIQRNEYVLSSGAGFTHTNYISAGALCRILNYVRNQRSISSTFVASLPIAGVDGTLRTRMRKTPAQGKVQAKTGYLGKVVTRVRRLDGVVGLGGYATSASGKVLTFVFIYNGTRPASIVRQAFDKICVELVSGTIDSVSTASSN
jgi:serine-type D-Ala-D-Ala carboxypeptidase/endopeptidase (penicillin-binding protein 4)